MQRRPMDHQEHNGDSAGSERREFVRIQQQGGHCLPFEQYLRARELGVELPEAEASYNVGLNYGVYRQPVKVMMPPHHPLRRCYRLAPHLAQGDESVAANANLLAVLGQLDQPFVPVEISPPYAGYSWARLATIDRVVLSVGQTLVRDTIAYDLGALIGVDALAITVHTSDGRVFTSPVCMAVQPREDALAGGQSQSDEFNPLYLTLQARTRLEVPDIWCHFGGGRGDYASSTYESERLAVYDTISRFWSLLTKAGEVPRTTLLNGV